MADARLGLLRTAPPLAPAGAFDDLPDAAISLASKHPIARARLRIGQHGIADPGRRIVSHGIGKSPEQIAPGDDLAEQRLIASEFV